MMNDLIEKLSNLRSQFNCFNENERDAYSTLSEAIKVLSERPEPCEGAVSREDVQSIAERSDWFESSDSFNDFLCALYALPSVTPKRKTGKWMYSDFPHEFLHCSECGRGRYFCSNFCPNCGADMRGKQSESEGKGD